jgi:L-ribulose-5-phosphate 3-epimerase
VTESLTSLCQYAAKDKINVVVENHGGMSSNGKWLSGVMKQVNLNNCGTLPDFGNFRVSATEEYDRYLGMQELMPFAKGVSAKSHDFDEQGNETQKDFYRIMKIVKDSGYKGWVGIEYEGNKLGEPEGIMATKRLLEKVFATL